LKPERIGEEVQRELRRFGPAAGMTEIVRAWPAAVGREIAENAWPARLSRDGTLHLATSSSTWAFELAQLEPKLLERLVENLGAVTPSRLRFAPGKLPERSADDDQRDSRPGREPTAEELQQAAAIADAIEDESLRKIVAKAAASSLGRRP
jgi:predicted nucleic acid-binding Zn ribbon protein